MRDHALNFCTTQRVIRMDAKIRTTAEHMSDLVARAEAINWGLADLCRKSGVLYSTARRWQQGKARPTADDFAQARRAFEAALSAEEMRLRGALSAGGPERLSA